MSNEVIIMQGKVVSDLQEEIWELEGNIKTDNAKLEALKRSHYSHSLKLLDDIDAFREHEKGIIE